MNAKRNEKWILPAKPLGLNWEVVEMTQKLNVMVIYM